MECSKPGAVSDAELLAYLDGEQVRPAVPEHVAQCAYCSSQVANYRRIDHQLLQKLYRWDCPSSLELGEYQLEVLSLQRRAEIASHLRSCVLCSSEVATLSDFLAFDPILREPVLSAQNSAQPVVSSNHHVETGVPRLLDSAREHVVSGARRVIATLLPPQPILAYSRDLRAQAPAVDSWPRRYTAEDVSISLQVERAPHASQRPAPLQLLGFVTRKGTTLEALQGTPVHLIPSTETAAQSASTDMQNIDELGNFVFSPLAPNTYSLELQFPEGVVVIEQITLPGNADTP